MKAHVWVMLKSTVLDPQGKAIHHALASLGHQQVRDVRQGKRLRASIAVAAARKPGQTLLVCARSQLGEPRAGHHRGRENCPRSVDQSCDRRVQVRNCGVRVVATAKLLRRARLGPFPTPSAHGLMARASLFSLMNWRKAARAVSVVGCATL